MFVFRLFSKKYVALFLITIFFFELTLSFKIFAQIEPIIQSDSAIVMDSKTGAILYGKNIHRKQYPASITKIMTALLAIEKGNPKDIITFSDNAVYSIDWGSSHIGMREGEQITLNDALYGMLLMSANEVSNAIAEHIDGSVENFADSMNEKAKELGAYNTHFVNPHGLHDPDHYTTAYDMALITREALKYDKFREVAGTLTYVIPPTNLVNEPRYLAHQHRLYNNKAYPNSYYEGCEGGKTGYTNEARHTLVTFAKREDLELIVVVLKSEKQEMYEDTKRLLDYGFENFEPSILIEAGASAGKVTLGQNEGLKEEKSVEVYAEKTLETVLPKELTEDIKQEITLSDKLSFPIYEGDVIGSLNYIYKNEIIASVNVLSAENVEGNDSILESLSQNDIKKKSASITDNKVIRLSIMSVLTILILVLFFLTINLINRLRQKRRYWDLFKDYNKR